VSRSSYQVRAYNLKHRYDVNKFLEAYRRLLQKAKIWGKIRWVEKRAPQPKELHEKMLQMWDD
jgi:hypothetical protein